MPHKFVLRDAGGRDNPVGEATAIGRDAACQILLTGDPLVSRRHALLWAQDDAVYVRDENSSNGTFVNGQRLAPNQALRLQVGDKVGVGSTLFLLIAAETPPPTVIAARSARQEDSASAPVPVPAASAAPVASVPVSAPPRRRSLWLACAVVGVLAALVVCGAGAVVLSARGPALLAGLTGAPTPGLTPIGTFVPSAGPGGPTPAAIGGSTPAPAVVLATAPAPPLLTGQEYAASNQDLARAVADLNQAELDFVRAVSSTGLGASSVLARLDPRPPAAGDLDAKLLAVAANAFKTATIADRLSQTAASQAGGSPAAVQTASHYRGIARLAAALVIEAQNARPGLADGSVPAKTVAGMVAEYGLRLWNPSAIRPLGENPFSPLLPVSAQVPAPQELTSVAFTQVTTGLGGSLTAWVAASAETVTKTLTLPPATGPVTLANDAAAQANLATASGQSDGTAARAQAAAMLRAGGGIPANEQLGGGVVTAALPSGVAVADPKTSAASLPAYSKGSGSAVTIIPASNDTASTLLQFGTGGEVTPGDQTAINQSSPLVTVTLSNIIITQINKRAKDAFNTFEADVVYEFDVQWTSNLASPQFTLDCVSGNHFDITSASGKQHISAKGLLILFPGAEDAFCYAAHNGNTWGSASVHFLVGDAAEATQRAIQVETDSVSLDLTLTADAVGTAQAATANAAASQAVLGTQNALETEVAADRTQEFAATITAIARQTQLAVPTLTEIPLPTATFAPVFVEQVFHSGDMFATSTKNVMQTGRLYQFCFSGEVNLVNPDRAVPASEIDHVNGIAVPRSGCLVIEGDGKAAVITCGQGEAAEEPGGYTIRVFDLGPT